MRPLLMLLLLPGCVAASGSSFFNEQTAASEGTGRAEVCDVTVAAGGAPTIACPGITAVDGHHLYLTWYLRSEETGDVQDEVLLAFNDDTTGTNYIISHHYGGTITGGARNDVRHMAFISTDDAAAGLYNVGQCIVPFFSDTTQEKFVECQYGQERSGAQPNLIWNHSIQWENTAAVSDIDLTLNSASDFVAGSRFTVWSGP